MAVVEKYFDLSSQVSYLTWGMSLDLGALFCHRGQSVIPKCFSLALIPMHLRPNLPYASKPSHKLVDSVLLGVNYGDSLFCGGVTVKTF